MFNDFYARRLSQSVMFQNVYRAHGPLWRATNVTREKLDGRFVEEEFMRVNGQRAMPLLVGASSLVAPRLSNFQWTHLLQTQAPSVSMRAAAVQHQTALTRQCAKVGLLQAATAQVRADSTAQSLLLEGLSRSEGVLQFTPLQERPDLEESADEVATAGVFPTLD